MPNEISIVFYNGWNYDYNFIIQELANEFEEQFESLGERKYTKVKNIFCFNVKRNQRNR